MADTKTTPPIVSTMVLKQSPSSFRFDKTKDEWMPVEDTPIEGEPKLRLDTLLLESESSLVGHTMLERANEGALEQGSCAGQHHAERMLEQQESIPSDWRKVYLVFAGTIWRSPSNGLYVMILCWHGNEWRPRWHLLDRDLDACYRLVRLGK